MFIVISFCPKILKKEYVTNLKMRECSGKTATTCQLIKLLPPFLERGSSNLKCIDRHMCKTGC